MCAYVYDLPDKPESSLMQAIKSGDVGYVRKLFQEVFWAGAGVFVPWECLKIAVLKENRDMVKLLITWGATGTPEQVAELKYNRYVKILRSCGMKGPLPKLPDEPSVGVLKSDSEKHEDWGAGKRDYEAASRLPQDVWLVMESFAQNGAEEAVVAGATLRDAFNGVAIKSADIFLKSRRNKWDLIEKAFHTAGFDVHPTGGADRVIGKDGKVVSEVWYVTANQIPYRISFVESNLVDDEGPAFAGKLIEQFDFGFSQIAAARRPLTCFTKQSLTVGPKVQVLVTKAFEADMTAKEIRLVKENSGSPATLIELIKKYPDWKRCEKSKKLLAKPVIPPTRDIFE